MMPNKEFWAGKKVILTGHTGFKGSWLTLWLHKLGAEVNGYALDPTAQQQLYNHLDISSFLNDHRGDIRDFRQLANVVANSKSEILIHMAAKSTVRESYHNPVDTFSTNVMGTVNILEAARYVDCIRAILIVTSDKCYENFDVERPYKETDPLGGLDPYSSSKGCVELVTQAFRKSYFHNSSKSNIGVATARAGNVIGGGDWTKDRIVPDAMRAFFNGSPLLVRFPNATRPWQHIFEPLSGYLLLCERLWDNPNRYSGSWNFGPDNQDISTVSTLCDLLVQYYGTGAAWSPMLETETLLHEAVHLGLDITKAIDELDWLPQWNLDIAVKKTVECYKLLNANKDAKKFGEQQIDEYMEAMRS